MGGARFPKSGVTEAGRIDSLQGVGGSGTELISNTDGTDDSIARTFVTKLLQHSSRLGYSDSAHPRKRARKT